MALAAFLGIVSAFDIPTRQAFLVEMVGKDDLMNAIALNTSVFNLTRVLGPVIAGFLIGAEGVAICFFLNGLSYLAVIASLLAMRLPRWTPRVAAGSAWEGFREVVQYLRGDRRASTLVALTAIISIFGFPYLVLMPVFARDVLRVGAAGYGMLSAAVGIGAVAGALTVAVFSARIPKGRTLVVAGTLFGGLLTVFSLSRSFAVALGVLVLVGAAMIVNNALTNTLLQTHVPDHLRGRVMGFYSFMFVGMAPLGAFQAGVVAERFGAPAAVGLGGVLSALAIVVAGWRVAELRQA
jgi:MFS family permease